MFGHKVFFLFGGEAQKQGGGGMNRCEVDVNCHVRAGIRVFAFSQLLVTLSGSGEL